MEVPAETQNPLNQQLYLNRDCNSKVVLDSLYKEELNSWISNLNYLIERSTIFHYIDLLIQSDISRSDYRVEGFFSEDIDRSKCSQAEQELHKNLLKLRAEKFPILIFCIYKKNLAVYVQINVQMDNETALAF